MSPIFQRSARRHRFPVVCSCTSYSPKTLFIRWYYSERRQPTEAASFSTEPVPNLPCVHATVRLVYTEGPLSEEATARRERQLKRRSRAKKLALIREELHQLRDSSRSRD
jgi:hypothetical protein